MAAFDDLAQRASKLSREQQTKMLFILLANLSSYYKFELGEKRTMDKSQTAEIIAESLHQAEL